MISSMVQLYLPGHFLLTNLLLDKMKETAKATGIEGRIVNLSSVAHLLTYKEGIQFDKITDESVYAILKLFCMLRMFLFINNLS